MTRTTRSSVTRTTPAPTTSSNNDHPHLTIPATPITVSNIDPALLTPSIATPEASILTPLSASPTHLLRTQAAIIAAQAAEITKLNSTVASLTEQVNYAQYMIYEQQKSLNWREEEIKRLTGPVIKSESGVDDTAPREGGEGEGMARGASRMEIEKNIACWVFAEKEWKALMDMRRAEIERLREELFSVKVELQNGEKEREELTKEVEKLQAMVSGNTQGSENMRDIKMTG